MAGESKISGVSKELDSLKSTVSGTSKTVSEGYTLVGGSWKKIWPDTVKKQYFRMNTTDGTYAWSYINGSGSLPKLTVAINSNTRYNDPYSYNIGLDGVGGYKSFDEGDIWMVSNTSSDEGLIYYIGVVYSNTWTEAHYDYGDIEYRALNYNTAPTIVEIDESEFNADYGFYPSSGTGKYSYFLVSCEKYPNFA